MSTPIPVSSASYSSYATNRSSGHGKRARSDSALYTRSQVGRLFSSSHSIENIEQSQPIRHVARKLSHPSSSVEYPLLPVSATPKEIQTYLDKWLTINPVEKFNKNNNYKSIQIFLKIVIKKVNSLYNKSLYLQGNQLPPVFHTQVFIQNLYRLSLDHYIANELPDFICSLFSINYLRIAHSPIRIFPDTLSQLSQLCNLHIEKVTFVEFPKSITTLTSLETLNIKNCRFFSQIPSSISALTNLKKLSLVACSKLAELPQSITALPLLETLYLHGCRKLTELPEFLGTPPLRNVTLPKSLLRLPISLYQLGLKRPFGFLSPPWSETVHWMKKALRKQKLIYEIRANAIRVQTRRDTSIPFATQHVQLLVEAFNENAVFRKGIQTPLNSTVHYIKEEGHDVGGLSRHFWSQLLPNIAKQTQHDHPLLKQTQEGFYVLEKEMGRTLSYEEIALCEQIGAFFSHIVSSLDENCKSGIVFEEHFFTLLLYLQDRYSRGFWKASLEKDGPLLCFFLACDNKKGIQENGDLLFDLHLNDVPIAEHMRLNKDVQLASLLQHSHRLPRATLYKLWRILNVQEEEEALSQHFPKLTAFITPYQEMPLSEDNLNQLTDDFANYLAHGKAHYVAESIMQHAYETYQRQCEPLLAVARGFRQVNVTQLEKVSGQIPRFRGQQLSIAIQGEPFTRQKFIEKLDASVNSSYSTYRLHAAVTEKMRLLQEWYGRDETTDTQMKDFIRCMTGNEEIKPSTSLKFNGTNNSWSVFHTCFSSVDLGKQLLDMPLDTPTRRQAFITLWLKNIDMALNEAGFNLS